MSRAMPVASGITGRGRRGGATAGALSVRRDGALGQVVTDGQGYTLYRFDGDTGDPPRTTCEGTCAEIWLPVPAADAEAGKGIAADLLGSVVRADGSRQLTLGGRPLYRYAEDTEPGTAVGHGVAGAWFAAAPDGAVAAKELPELSATDNPDLGRIVRDAEGRTLYRFAGDSPLVSTCTGACLTRWQPVGPVDRVEVSGIDPDLLGLITRSGAGWQLTLNGWPLYWYTGDSLPGDINGHGVDGQWSAVTPEGTNATVTRPN